MNKHYLPTTVSEKIILSSEFYTFKKQVCYLFDTRQLPEFSLLQAHLTIYLQYNLRSGEDMIKILLYAYNIIHSIVAHN